jgi:hypothetical protein
MRVAVAAAIAILCLCAVMHAAQVTNVTAGTTVFKDNFETGAFAPSIGSWTIIGPDVTVTNSTAPPDPGPAEGSFYAKLFRNSDAPSQGNLQAHFLTQSNPGDLIRLSFMAYLPDDGIDSRAQFILDDGDFNSARAWFRPDGAGNVIAVGPGFAVTDTGVDYTPNTWQEWDLEYVVGASTFGVRVNGVSASGFPSFTTGEVAFADLFNGSKVPGSLYLDAVPPPATPAPEPAAFLLSACGVALLAKRRRLNNS